MSVLASEWLKVRTVRSSYLMLGLSLGGILLGVAVAWAAVGTYDSATPAQQAHAAIADLEEVVLMVPQLCMGVLGVLTITSEYTTGLIRTSLAIVPRRWPVLAENPRLSVCSDWSPVRWWCSGHTPPPVG